MGSLEKGRVSAIWIFQSVLQSRGAADHLTCRDIGLLPLPALTTCLSLSELLLQELCPLSQSSQQHSICLTVQVYIYPHLFVCIPGSPQRCGPVKHRKIVEFWDPHTHKYHSFSQYTPFLHHFWALLLKPLNCLLLLSCGHLAKMQLDKLGSLLISFTFSDKPNQVRVK